MIKKPTITIGIPAYNEAANIGWLLMDIITQVTRDFTIDKIIVFSDGSDDDTVKLAKAVGDQRVEVIESKERNGQAVGQNTIMSLANSDVLVLFNADISLSDRHFIEKLARPILLNRAELTSASLMPLDASTFFEKMLIVSIQIKNIVFENYRDGNNLFTCHGTARAMSQKFYKDLKFHDSVGEDAYSYLYCARHGYRYVFVKDTFVYFRLPNNFHDHQKQSIRYFRTKKRFVKEFGNKFVRAHTSIPFNAYKQLVYALPLIIRYPLHVFVYSVVVLFLKFKSFVVGTGEQWPVASSSKVLRRLQ